MEKLSEQLNQCEHQLIQICGEVLKSKRKERGITLIELSKKTGVSRKAIADFELGIGDLTAPQKVTIHEFVQKQRII